MFLNSNLTATQQTYYQEVFSGGDPATDNSARAEFSIAFGHAAGSGSADLTGNLKQEHGESRKWWAVNSDNELIELYVNNKNGAWTIVITNNQKLSCALIGADHSGANYDIDSTVETIQ